MTVFPVFPSNTETSGDASNEYTPSPAERSLAAKAAAEMSWAKTKDPVARTAPARAAFRQKFMDQANGDPVRAGHLERAYMARLGHKGLVARRKARDLALQAEAAERELKDFGGDVA